MNRPRSIAPLVSIRIIFGLIMSFSMLRFLLKGWVYDLYIAPKVYFPFYGFEWVKPLPDWAMYALFIGLVISFLMVAIGAFYRFAISFSFLAFTYIELIDKTNYLNHYYFVSIFCFLLVFLPAARSFSIDSWRNPKIRLKQIANYKILLLQLQLTIVYFYAGMAKLNADWLMEAMPLKIWLPSKADLWLIGPLLKEEAVAYLFSWGGAAYDLLIPFLLFNRKSRWFAYGLVIVFHMLTYWLFQIGMFPFIMIGATLIFFSDQFHLNFINKIKQLFSWKRNTSSSINFMNTSTGQTTRWKLWLVGGFLMLQLIIPFRYLAYPGNLFWTEEGYRFSWRVMLMEKAGYAIFHIEDPESGRKWEVNNYDFLTAVQEKMVATQPDMILQFAHFLDKYYQSLGVEDPVVKVESHVSLNGHSSRLLIQPEIDLSRIKDGFEHKDWILPFKEASTDS